ncbi:ankyrin repeat domain-containing protein [Legionella worsleiensis]|uniref:Uncharacterized protein n=2 Tax=Legionella worsleiensis TaxID=45076 RepID=A0A0W1AKJ6_9GAMM|nr:hypothetical protein Lwor_0079 [Legionella worsleiensis]STY31144.1 Uncharacterised protein [Legionella worsleiensis]
MVKYAVILQTTTNTNEFRSSFGLYNKQIHDLKQVGYEILEISVDEFTDLTEQISKLPRGSVGLLWFRMHGSPKSMVASKSLKINLENITEIFSSLPDVLCEDATVFLDSCSTGSFKNDLNNMQFAFAKLTLEKPFQEIVAPSRDCHVSWFTVLSDGRFRFEMLNSHRSDDFENIAVTLGQSTKKILKEAIETNTPIDSLRAELIDSLHITIHCPFLANFKQSWSKILFGTGFDLTSMLIKVIENISDSGAALALIKELIEVYHANPNYPADYLRSILLWENATPLSAAVYFQRAEIVLYLLTQGADLSFTLKGETLLDLAKQRDEMKEDDYDEMDMREMLIAVRRKKEKDISKMVDTIANYLELKREPQDTLVGFSRKQTFWCASTLASSSVATPLVQGTSHAMQSGH